MHKLLVMAVLSAFSFTSGSALACHHMGKGEKFQKMDADGDGSISKSEFISKHEKKFSNMDADGDGVLTPQELKAAKEQRKAKKKEYKYKQTTQTDE